MKIEKLKNDPRLPNHMALIIDGNGRWAKKRGLPRSAGHKAGFENLKKHIEYCQKIGIKVLSLYCFSKQNWNRPEKEVEFLMNTFNQVLDEYKEEYKEKDVRINICGDMDDERLTPEIRSKAKKLMEDTKDKTGFILNACINYGGREEILHAVNEIIAFGETNIDEKLFDKHLYTAGLPPVDFIIRTSGETRTSNFLPWQATYSEWYFPKIYWPSFSEKDLIKALKIYMKRNRRFGAIKG